MDTSYLLALISKNDQYHTITKAHWQQLLIEDCLFIITSYIFDETVTYLNSRYQHQSAIEIGEILLNHKNITFIHVDKKLFNQGWNDFKKYSDKQFSLTDCISFIVMRQHRVITALTFDKHFVQAGFKTKPK